MQYFLQAEGNPSTAGRIFADILIVKQAGIRVDRNAAVMLSYTHIYAKYAGFTVRDVVCCVLLSRGNIM